MQLESGEEMTEKGIGGYSQVLDSLIMQGKEDNCYSNTKNEETKETSHEFELVRGARQREGGQKGVPSEENHRRITHASALRRRRRNCGGM